MDAWAWPDPMPPVHWNITRRRALEQAAPPLSSDVAGHLGELFLDEPPELRLLLRVHLPRLTGPRNGLPSRVSCDSGNHVGVAHLGSVEYGNRLLLRASDGTSARALMSRCRGCPRRKQERLVLASAPLDVSRAPHSCCAAYTVCMNSR